MYSKLELEVIASAKVWGFAAYLQGCLFRQAAFQRGEYKRKDLEFEFNEMTKMKRDFDYMYTDKLIRAEVNPLVEEQQMWKELSPKVESFLNRFGEYLPEYKEKSKDKAKVKKFVAEWGGILQDWNKLSNSYRAKYEEYCNMKTLERIERGEIPDFRNYVKTDNKKE